MSLDWLPGLDLSNGTFTLPLWAVGVSLALLVALIVIAVVRTGLTELGSMIFRIAVILIAVVFGWTYVTRVGERDRMDERRALDNRAAELTGRAIARPTRSAARWSSARRSSARSRSPLRVR